MIGRLINFIYKIKYRFFLDKRVEISPDNVFIHNAATFIVTGNSNSKITINKDVYVGRYANIHTGSQIIIGEGAVLSDYVYLSTLSHGLDPQLGPIMQQESYDKGPIILGENVFIGFGCKIMPNVTLGDWCIVGAGAVVTKSFPGYVMIAGNPAKIIKKYDSQSNKWVS
ncbi:acyltransferase [Aeromonas veronii]|uniref:acyltransferase n=1 Tax=Aeromonas TaxID=642 RepID=UPI00286D8CD3|nr:MULTISPECIES: acyltransferase [Aeromonas]MCS3790616.1 maltose O-acetyltransferase [Aeromonas hydrophila]UCP16148.1 acyltransferase [Aeromonas media]